MKAESRKISVAQLGPMPPPHGGVSTNMLAIHDALREKGHESVIVDMTNRNEKADAEHVLKPRSAFDLVRLLMKLDTDIVHYHIGGEFSVKLAMLTLFCGLLPGKKSVVTFHSGGYAKKISETARPWSLRGVAFRAVDFVTGVNEQMIEMFRRYGVREDRTRLILPFELRQADRAVAIPQDLSGFAERSEPFLLSVGALEHEYLNEFAIESMPTVIERFPNAGLLIAGSGSLRQELTRKVDVMGLNEKVILAGNVDHSVLLHLIERSALLLRLTEYDGDAISVREALFLGTPVVATDNGMRPDGVNLLSTPLKAEDLVNAISNSFTEEAKPQTDFVESNAEKMIELYQKLLTK